VTRSSIGDTAASLALQSGATLTVKYQWVAVVIEQREMLSDVILQANVHIVLLNDVISLSLWIRSYS
jgi:hypothetical protein